MLEKSRVKAEADVLGSGASVFDALDDAVAAEPEVEDPLLEHPVIAKAAVTKTAATPILLPVRCKGTPNDRRRQSESA
jgi:hypothetical protein